MKCPHCGERTNAHDSRECALSRALEVLDPANVANQVELLRLRCDRAERRVAELEKQLREPE